MSNNSNVQTINIRHMLLISLGSSYNCFKTIDTIYKENENEFFELYLKSEMYNDALKEVFFAEELEHINKLIGIFEYCYKQNSFIYIEKIIQSLNKSLVRYVKTKNTISPVEFLNKYTQESTRTDMLTFSIIISLIYLATLYNKPYDNRVLYIVSQAWNKIIDSAKLINATFDSSLIQNNIQKWYQDIGIPYSDSSDILNLDTCITNYINNTLNTMLKEKRTIYCKDDLDRNQKIRSSLFKNHKYLRFLGAVNFLLNTVGIYGDGLYDNIVFSSREFNKLIASFIQAASPDSNNFTDEDFPQYITFALTLYALAQKYNNLKNQYLNTSKIEQYHQLQNLQNEINSKQEKLNQSIENNKKIILEKDREIKELNATIKALNNELSDVKKENIALNNYKNNLEEANREIALDKHNLSDALNDMKNFLNSSNTEETPSIDEMCNYINKFSIGIFGGFKNISNLASKLYNTHFYTNKNEDISSISKLDYLFINTNFFNHSFMYKVDTESKKYNTNYGYISGTNLELIIYQIYTQMKSKLNNI